MRCEKCGNEVKPGEAFCPECGASVPQDKIPSPEQAVYRPAQSYVAGSNEGYSGPGGFIPEPGVKYGTNAGARVAAAVATALMIPPMLLFMLSLSTFLISGKMEYEGVSYAVVDGIEYGFSAAELQNFFGSPLLPTLFGGLSLTMLLIIMLVNIAQFRYALIDIGIASLLSGVALMFFGLINMNIFMSQSMAEFLRELLDQAAGVMKSASFISAAVGVLCIAAFVILNISKPRRAIKFKKLSGKYKLWILVISLFILLVTVCCAGIAASGILELKYFI